MPNSARSLYQAELMRHWYPAFSRRATQVCVLSSALEKIAGGATDAQAIALSALNEADAFGWRQRNSTDACGVRDVGICSTDGKPCEIPEHCAKFGKCGNAGVTVPGDHTFLPSHADDPENGSGGR